MSIDKQEEIAWSHFLSQHQNSQNMEGFVKPFFAPMTTLANSLDRMTFEDDIEASSGARLDLVGSIVGATRFFPQGISLAFFGFISQPSGRAFGVARMRHEDDAITQSYTAGDVEYRTLIKTKIALNNGHGTAPEIARAAKIAFNAPVVSARDAGEAHIELWVGRIPSLDEGLGKIIPDYLPKLAGVSMNIVFWSPSLPFGFISNKHFGFGVGIMARTPLS